MAARARYAHFEYGCYDAPLRVREHVLFATLTACLQRRARGDGLTDELREQIADALGADAVSLVWRACLVPRSRLPLIVRVVHDSAGEASLRVISREAQLKGGTPLVVVRVDGRPVRS